MVDSGYHLPGHIHSISLHTFFLLECPHDAICDLPRTGTVQRYHLWLLLLRFNSVLSLLDIICCHEVLGVSCRFSVTCSHVDDRLRRSIETEPGILSFSIVFVCD